MSTASSPLREMTERPELLGNIISTDNKVACTEGCLVFYWKQETADPDPMWRADRRQAFSSAEYGRPQVGCHKTNKEGPGTIWKHTRKKLTPSLSNKSWSVSERPNQSQWFQTILMFLFYYCITTKWQDWKCHRLWNHQAKKGRYWTSSWHRQSIRKLWRTFYLCMLYQDATQWHVTLALAKAEYR